MAGSRGLSATAPKTIGLQHHEGGEKSVDIEPAQEPQPDGRHFALKRPCREDED